MKGWAREHLEKVANRNYYLFKEDRESFIGRMQALCWSRTDIEAMVKYLERRERNEKSQM